jgi:biopolymer transport protein ExbD
MALRRKKPADVELNLAAMLDMAFQLLTFFILTFKPAPVEGQIDLRLPQYGWEPPGRIAITVDPVVISIYPTPDGQINSLTIGEGDRVSLPQLETTLRTMFREQGTGLDRVIIQVGSALRYEELMKVIGICSRQTLANGSKLSKLSFVELPGGN